MSGDLLYAVRVKGFALILIRLADSKARRCLMPGLAGWQQKHKSQHAIFCVRARE